MKTTKRQNKKSAGRKIFFQSPKGMRDILPEDQFIWEKIRDEAVKIAGEYGYLRIDTPILESADIFERTGEGTDIVEKQMYFIKDKKDGSLVLRPEGTAPIMRAYIQNGLNKIAQPLKLFYIGPMFRHESPQAGRYRQFYQAGFEILGADGDPIYDAQIILASLRLLEELKIKNLVIQINSIGCKHCRLAYQRKLQQYYKNHQNKICKDCRERLQPRPLRLLDCKDEKCAPIKAKAPIILDQLCGQCKKHFKNVLEYLDELSLSYNLNPHLVRGLDYYNRTVFEIFSDMPQFSGLALASGGRYDHLSEMISHKQICAVGSAVGMDRVAELLKSSEIKHLPLKEQKVFLIHIGDEAKKKGLSLFEELRKAGVKAVESFGRESLKSQLKAADKSRARLSLILGQKEVFEEVIIIRDMKSGAQETAPLKKMVEEVKKMMKAPL